MEGKGCWTRITLLFWGIVFLAAIIKSISSFSMPSFDRYVYTTPYGEKYHYYDCYYLDDAEYLNSYDNYLEAESYGYTSCSKCGNKNHSIITIIDIKLDKKD